MSQDVCDKIDITCLFVESSAISGAKLMGSDSFICDPLRLTTINKAAIAANQREQDFPVAIFLLLSAKKSAQRHTRARR